MPPPSSINKQLDRIENAIIGNGHEGLLARTARIEEQLKGTIDTAAEAKESAEKAIEHANDVVTETTKIVNALALNVTKLEGLLMNHVGTDHLSVMMKKKQFWAMIIIGFIALHIVSTYLPNVWDSIMLLVGLPKLTLPIN